MTKHEDKISRAVHVKRHTVGTSNEISFSVLDAAKNALEGGDERTKLPRMGHISLFTLSKWRKKAVGTPMKENELPLSNSTAPPFPSSSTPTPVVPTASSPALSSSPDGFSSSANDAGSKGAEKKLDRRRKRAERKEARRARYAEQAAARTRDEEIAWRKARRRRGRIAAAVAVVLILAVLAAAGTIYLQKEFSRHQENVDKLHEALSLVEGSDEVLIGLDELVSQPFDEKAASAWADLQEKVPETRQKLADAEAKARSAQSDLRNSEDKEASNQAIAAIMARNALLDAGVDALEAARISLDAEKSIAAAWERVLSGDSLAREAAGLASDTTADNIMASKDKSAEAVAEFEQALALLQESESAYAEADLSAQIAYVAKRIEALGYAMASDEAFLARNTEEAAAQNDAYNIADGEAAALAGDLPENPAQSVVDACDELLSPLMDAYSTARLQAESADAFLRDYLGTGSK